MCERCATGEKFLYSGTKRGKQKNRERRQSDIIHSLVYLKDYTPGVIACVIFGLDICCGEKKATHCFGREKSRSNVTSYHGDGKSTDLLATASTEYMSTERSIRGIFAAVPAAPAAVFVFVVVAAVVLNTPRAAATTASAPPRSLR